MSQPGSTQRLTQPAADPAGTKSSDRPGAMLWNVQDALTCLIGAIMASTRSWIDLGFPFFGTGMCDLDSHWFVDWALDTLPPPSMTLNVLGEYSRSPSDVLTAFHVNVIAIPTIFPRHPNIRSPNVEA